jgi:hypothetical protein
MHGRRWRKNLPQRALVALLRAFSADDPISVLAATRAQLRSIVPESASDRVLAPLAAERSAATRAWLDNSGPRVDRVGRRRLPACVARHRRCAAGPFLTSVGAIC